MSALMRRVERLEQQRNAKDSLTVFLLSWSGDGPIALASYGGSDLLREDGESEEDFSNRAEAWAQALPGQSWGRVVWMRRR